MVNETLGGDAGLKVVLLDKCRACSAGSLVESIDGCHKFVNISGANANGAPLIRPTAFGPVQFDESTSSLRFTKMDAFRRWRGKIDQEEPKRESTAKVSTAQCQSRFRVLVESKVHRKYQIRGVFGGVCRHLVATAGRTTVIDTVSLFFINAS